MLEAILVLADGTIFKGKSIGVTGNSVGEVVFNTSMTGYQEIITDPSYANQIITLTTPHIGNVGINSMDWESDKIHSAGLIVKDSSIIFSSWRAEKSLTEFLVGNNVVAISDIDTRKLTRILRNNGAQNACIMAGEINQAKALELAREFKGLKGMDLAKKVTVQEKYIWQEGKEWSLEDDNYMLANDVKFNIVAYDFGIKKNILRKLAQRGCEITVIPAETKVEDVLALNPDGVFLSNGPGDPEPCTYAISAVKELLNRKVPIFGICLGMQILSIAAGAKTKKMKFGHHGANHPVEDVLSKKVYITSQNHGFAVDEDMLNENIKVTHRSLFDDSLQGISLNDSPAFGFQGHPEASPGPQDIDYLFDEFISMIKTNKKTNH